MPPHKFIRPKQEIPAYIFVILGNSRCFDSLKLAKKEFFGI